MVSAKDVARVVRLLAEERGEAFSGFKKLVEATGRLSIGRKTAELIALGIAIAIGCEYCVEYHAREALRAGATRDELLDVLVVALLMRGGPAIPAATRLVKVLEEAGGESRSSS